MTMDSNAKFYSCQVSGDPVGKPRMTRSDKWKKRKCVLEYRDWADSLRLQVLGSSKNFIEPKEGEELELCIDFYIQISKSDKKSREMYPHTKRPDIDNLIKSVLDALITRDSCVHKICARKFFVKDYPGIDISICSTISPIKDLIISLEDASLPEKSVGDSKARGN